MRVLRSPQAGLADLKAQSAAELEAARTQVVCDLQPCLVPVCHAGCGCHVLMARMSTPHKLDPDIYQSCVPQLAELSAACEAAVEQLHSEEAAHAHTRRKLVQRFTPPPGCNMLSTHVVHTARIASPTLAPCPCHACVAMLYLGEPKQASSIRQKDWVPAHTGRGGGRRLRGVRGLGGARA